MSELPKLDLSAFKSISLDDLMPTKALDARTAFRCCRADLLELLDDRVGTHSTIVLGQMPVKDWHGFKNNPALTDALLDRLVHSSLQI